VFIDQRSTYIKVRESYSLKVAKRAIFFQNWNQNVFRLGSVDLCVFKHIWCSVNVFLTLAATEKGLRYRKRLSINPLLKKYLTEQCLEMLSLTNIGQQSSLAVHVWLCNETNMTEFKFTDYCTSS